MYIAKADFTKVRIIGECNQKGASENEYSFKNFSLGDVLPLMLSSQVQQ